MQSLGFESKNQTIYEIVAALDKDKSGDISFEEFTELMVSSTAKVDDLESVIHVFNLFVYLGASVPRKTTRGRRTDAPPTSPHHTPASTRTARAKSRSRTSSGSRRSWASK